MNLDTVEIKAFVPARDFELSKRFYEDLGFSVAWSSDDLAYLHAGASSFLLQRFYQQEHEANFMMHLPVAGAEHGGTTESIGNWRNARRESARNARQAVGHARLRLGNVCSKTHDGDDTDRRRQAMARDKGLEELIRDELQAVHGLSEKAMFGGWAWLLDGNLLCGARDDGMLIRLGKGRDAWALRINGVLPMLSGERVMHGWVRCGPDVYGEDALRKKLLFHAMEFVRSLPGK